jgi:molybdopterin synthase catalytic subunit
MVRLTREPIDVSALSGAAPEDGAVCLFLGVVRNENGGRPVRHLEYEAYEEMARPLMEEIAAEARRRWPVTDVHIVHRLGRLEIGEPSVAVAVAAPHRAAAFEACRYAIDTLKATVPIWKKSSTPMERSGWRDPKLPADLATTSSFRFPLSFF